jgi:hypothetical protein
LSLALLAALSFAALAVAAAPRDPRPAAPAAGARSVVTIPLSGRWILETAKSEMGKRLPRSREDLMDEQGPWLRVQSTSVRASGDTVRLDYRYRTDGDAVNRVLGQDVRTSGRRMGAILRFQSESQLALFKLTVAERWTLSPDGATLTQERTSNSPLGAEKTKLVFRRAR